MAKKKADEQQSMLPPAYLEVDDHLNKEQPVVGEVVVESEPARETHSKSEFRRLSTMGVDVKLPPETSAEQRVQSTPPPQKTEQAGSQVQSKDLIALDEAGLLKPTSENQLKRLVQYVVKSGMVPKSLDTPEKVMIAIQYGASFGIPPMKALRRIYIVNGTPSFWGETPLALVMSRGKLMRIIEFIVDKDYKRLSFENKNLDAEPFAAICQTWRKDAIQEAIEFAKMFNDGKLTAEDRQSIMNDCMREASFSVLDAEKAGLLHNTGKLYGKYLKDMLKYRARGRNLLDNYADDMQGMNMMEYHFPEELSRQNDMKDVSSSVPVLATANDINKELADEDPEEFRAQVKRELEARQA